MARYNKVKKRFHESSMNERDSGMIKEDRSAPSNMPQRAFIKMYAQAPSGADYEYMDDTILGTDAEMRQDADGMRRNRAKSRF